MDYKQLRQSMVNLDCGNSVSVDNKTVLHDSSTNSCDIVTGAGASSSSSTAPYHHTVLSYRNAKQNLSESCALNNAAAANACNACNSLKIRSSCNINWTTVDIDKKVNSDDPQNQSNYSNSGKTNNTGGGTVLLPAASSAQYLDLNNTASSISNLRTNSFKINDNNYSLYNNNQFGECNHIKQQVNKINGKNPATACGGQKNNFFKNFARSSSFLNGCKIRPNSKKLRNISLKLKKSEKVQPSCAQAQLQQQQHQLSCQNLHYGGGSCSGGGGSGGGSSTTTTVSGLIQNNCSVGTPSDGKNRASLKLNDSIRNVYARSNNQVIGNSDLKNQYNAKSNECNNCHTSCHQQHTVLNDFNKSSSSYVNGARAKNDKSARNKVFDRQLSVPIENTAAVNNLGIHATNKHCHSYSNSLNRSKKTGCKLNGRYVLIRNVYSITYISLFIFLHVYIIV